MVKRTASKQAGKARGTGAAGSTRPNRKGSKEGAKEAAKTGAKTGAKEAAKTGAGAGRPARVSATGRPSPRASKRGRAAAWAAGSPAGAGARPGSLLPGPDRAVVDALDELLGGRTDLRRGAMFGCPGYFAGSKAVACVFGAEMSVTVPPSRVDELVAQPGYRRFVAARGRAMNGWVLLDQERIAALEPGDALLEEAVAYARSKASKPRPG